MAKKVGYYNILAESLDIKYFKSIPHFADCNLAITIRDRSMVPSYNLGDVVICKRISNLENVSYGEAFIVVLADSYLLRFVHRHPKDKSHLLLRSGNDKSVAMLVKRKDGMEMYQVRGRLEIT